MADLVIPAVDSKAPLTYLNESLPEFGAVFLVHTDFYKPDGTEIAFYLTHHKSRKEPILADACRFLNDATQAGIVLRPKMLSDLAGTYGLKVTDELMLFDDSVDPIGIRQVRFAQCLVAFDGILRMWGAQSPARINPEMEK